MKLKAPGTFFLLLLFLSNPGTVERLNAGGISGQVILVGTPPPEKKIDMRSDPHCSTHPVDEVSTRNFIVGSGGGFANVLVYIKSGLPVKKDPPPTEPILLDQIHCNYNPQVVALRIGQKLKIRNSDSVFHNVHAQARRNPSFNIGQTEKGMVTDKIFNHPEVFIKINCDVHPWMHAYVAVLDHPYFHLTGQDGRFQLKDVPDGNYVLAAQHPRVGEQTVSIQIHSNQIVTTRFEYHAPSAP